MKTRFLLILAILIAAIAAFNAPAFADGPAAAAAFVEFNAANSNGYNADFDAAGRLVSLDSSEPADFGAVRGAGSDAVTMAVEFIRNNAAMFGVSDAAGLVPARVHKTAAITHVQFEHRVNGVRVKDSLITLHINGTGKVVAADNSYSAVSRAPLAAPAIDAEGAIKSAKAFLNCSSLRGTATAEPVIHNAGRATARAFEVSVPALEPLGDFIVTVDATTGAVLASRNIMNNADPLATVYVNNPIRCKITMEPLANLTNLPHTKRGLVGKWVAVKNDQQPSVLPNVGANYDYNNTDTNFSELSAYYHINRAHDYFNSIGFDKLDRSFEVIVHLSRLRDNAFFSPLNRNICIGDPVILNDLAREESVFYHEYTHAVTNAIANLEYEGESGAINEAHSDYFAGTMTEDTDIGEWVMAKKKLPYMRTMANKAHYPEDITNEVHLDSVIYSGGLWDMRRELGARTTDKLVHYSTYYLMGKPRARFSDGLAALLKADREHFNGKYAEAISRLMNARGIKLAPSSHNNGGPAHDLAEALKFNSLEKAAAK